MEKIVEFIKNEISWICSAHDFYHIERVCKFAKIIYKDEKKWDEKVIIISALLHEMFDNKFFSWKLEEQRKKVNEILENSDLTRDQIEKIIFIIENIWYWKSLWRKEKIEMIEFQIVEDADRLEAIWAISIARTFAYGWKHWRVIYDPKIPYEENLTAEKYWNANNSTTINHFYEKLLKLKDLLNTKKAREIAEKKHNFMEKFLEEFFIEWEVDY